MDISMNASGFDDACNAFVARSSHGRMCHLPEWNRMMARVLHYKDFYLVARQDQEILGVLPLVQVRSRLFGNRMISQPLSNYGGPLTQSPEVREALYLRSVDLAKELHCESIEFRNETPIAHDLSCREGKMCMVLPLTVDPQELWKSFDPKVRNQVRKAEKSNIICTSGGLEHLDVFYDLYSLRMHQLGTPAYSKKIMAAILHAFPQDSRIFIVSLEDRPIGAGFICSYNQFVEIIWAATLVEFNSLCPNNLLYWKVMEHYCLAGAKTFDFGRCTVESNTYRFKKQWGSQPVPLFYQSWHAREKFEDISLANASFQRKVEMWKRLPLWLARWAGPTISWGVP